MLHRLFALCTSSLSSRLSCALAIFVSSSMTVFALPAGSSMPASFSSAVT
jgi:hypothetical protein